MRRTIQFMRLRLRRRRGWKLGFACTVTGFLAVAAFAQYPQPQFEREQWLNLNGPWSFEFADSAVAPKHFTRSIAVPFCPESRNSGIADTGFHSSLWYRRTFTIPAGWQ